MSLRGTAVSVGGLESSSGSVNNSGSEEQWVGETVVVAGEPKQQRRGDVVTVTARVPAVGVSKLATSTAAVQTAQMQGAPTRQRAKQQTQPMRAVAPETDQRAEAVALPAVSAAEA